MRSMVGEVDGNVLKAGAPRSELAAHRDAVLDRDPAPSVLREDLAQGVAPFLLRQDAEAEPLVEGSVPRDVAQGGERDRAKARRACPRAHLLDERRADAAAAV